ncbi:hypothetical protein, partial [Escherichia coli]|uniref:hypothetical protein n=2 Tax=Enterobacterales TaxID=91347 RepID=UPI003EB9C22E
TADTSQLYALAARHGLKLHGPLTVNELGLDYRIVIATSDDARRRRPSPGLTMAAALPWISHRHFWR